MLAGRVGMPGLAGAVIFARPWFVVLRSESDAAPLAEQAGRAQPVVIAAPCWLEQCGP